MPKTKMPGGNSSMPSMPSDPKAFAQGKAKEHAMKAAWEAVDEAAKVVGKWTKKKKEVDEA